MAAQWFRRAYQQRFYVPPVCFESAAGTQMSYFDAPAYDAANIELNAIYQAALHGRLHGNIFQMRSAILPYVAHVQRTSFRQTGHPTVRKP